MNPTPKLVFFLKIKSSLKIFRARLKDGCHIPSFPVMVVVMKSVLAIDNSLSNSVTSENTKLEQFIPGGGWCMFQFVLVVSPRVVCSFDSKYR